MRKSKSHKIQVSCGVRMRGLEENKERSSHQLVKKNITMRSSHGKNNLDFENLTMQSNYEKILEFFLPIQKEPVVTPAP